MTNFKTVLTKDNQKVKLEVIDNISNYRGFYLIHKDGVLTKANYNQFALKDFTKSMYSKGFRDDLEGIEIFKYLYIQIESGVELSENELLEFYDKINLTNPYYLGIDFTEVMFKHTNLELYTLERKLNKYEKEIIKDNTVKADLSKII